MEVVGDANLVETSTKGVFKWIEGEWIYWLKLFVLCLPGHNTVVSHDLGKDPSSPSLHRTHGIVPPEQQSVTLISMGFSRKKST